ncbi:MAG TPA: hypothetical protein VGN81_17745 [Pseudonocardiaceae bacterium]|jgi:hypothetical protein
MTFDDLDETECWLANAVVSGTRLELAEPAPIRAELIRQLLLGGFHWPDRLAADPRGIRVRGAVIVGQLDLSGVHSALPLELVDCECAEGIVLSGARLSYLDFSGLVCPWLIASELVVERSLILSGARLRNPAGVALTADNIEVGGGLFCAGGFVAEGIGDPGTIRLTGAVIGNQLDFGGARLTNPDGPALVADYLRTGTNLIFNGGFHAEGRKATGTIRLVGASIRGRVNLEDGTATAVEPGALALNIGRVQVAGDVLFPVSFLDGAINLDGFRYTRILRSSVPEFLALLANRTNGYSAQPYRQFAATHLATGNERDVRVINVAAQRDLLRRGRLDFWARTWHRITGLVLGYGYRPSRALLWWAGTVALALVLLVGVAGPAGLITGHGVRCGTVDQAGIALNTATPLVKPAGQADCQLSSGTPLGDVLIVAGWVIQALSWAFVTLFVAGFTGLVRKNP